MLTEAEAQMVADAFLLRVSERDDQEFWFATPDLALIEAHELVELGYLDRRWNGEDILYRLTDRALSAQELHQAMAARAASMN